MKTLGYTLLSLVAAIWLIAMLAGLVAAYPYGLIGLLAFAGIGALFVHVITERLHNKEDAHYDKTVHQ